MKYEIILNKKAFSKDMRELGIIIKTEKLKVIAQKFQTYAIIRSKRFLKKDIFIPLSIKKVRKVTKQEVLFDITKKEFDELVKEKEKIEKTIKTLESTIQMNPRTGRSNYTYNITNPSSYKKQKRRNE
ncbi:MAG: hypothetical protein U9O98_06960 [Asgard group archaeon]|nr:hypothetical protein [Asgard group archaeon]